jgi:hypothetical protein
VQAQWKPQESLVDSALSDVLDGIEIRARVKVDEFDPTED